ncbi:RDD family protein [Thiohalophilus sp.]|uniref:RDD family protein n=1 Tax=Thiohalophilus sp. TaxID=3028392 RepID=UPI0039757F3A
MDETEYAGFWIRVGAALIDSLLVMIIIVPVINAVYGPGYWMSEKLVHGGWDVLLNYVFPAIAVIVFWVCKSATPGKMALKLTIVDAATGGKPSTGQFIGRYLSYYVSTIPLFLGLLWIGLDRRKQGWHDKLAGTVVIRDNRKEPEIFDSQ